MMSHCLAPVVLSGLLMACSAGWQGCHGAFEDPDADPETVIRDLKSPDLNTRRKAAGQLVSLAGLRLDLRVGKGDAVIRKRIKALAQIVTDRKEDSKVRAKVARAIAITCELGPVDRQIAPSFIQVLLDESEDEGVRSWIAMLLPDLVDKETAGPVVLTAARSKNVNVRANAAQQFGRLRLDPKVLIAWAEKAVAEPELRMEALATAEQLAKRHKRARAVTLRVAVDPDPLVREPTLKLLALLGVIGKADEHHLRLLVERLQADTDPGLASSAAVALLKLSGDRAECEKVLRKHLDAKGAADREAAARALSWAGPEAKGLAPALRKALTDPSQLVRAHAAMGLAQITGEKEQAVRVLERVKAAGDAEAKGWAELYLEQIAAKSRPGTGDAGKSNAGPALRNQKE